MSESLKEAVGAAIAERVSDGMVLGVGTGSTVDAALHQIGKRIKAEGLHLKAVTSSLDSARLCEEVGITVLHAAYSGSITLGFDGADAMDIDLRAIKGKGGAMLREKMLAVRCDTFILIVDESKVVENIAAHCPVPVEVVPEMLSYVSETLPTLGANEVVLRKAKAKHGAVITEFGNCILDTRFDTVSALLENDIKCIVGVVESGLFLSQAREALIARANRIEHIVKKG